MRALKSLNQLSAYQEAVIHHLETRRHLIVEARAGSGKTSTIVEAINSLPRDARILCTAFNRKISDELKKRLPSHVQTNTFNALGHALLRNYHGIDSELNTYKLEDCIDEVAHSHGQRNLIAQLVRGAVVYGYFPDKYEVNFSIRFDDIPCSDDFTFTNELRELVDQILDLYLSKIDTFDFNEQIYAPLALKLNPKFKYDYIFVDEAQDLSFTKMQLTFKYLSRGAKYIAIGDSKQAIYEFAGAQTGSMEHIQTLMNADVLKLPVCYRCPPDIIKEAQRIVPDIIAGDQSKPGKVFRINEEEFLGRQLPDNCMVLCRQNEPLFTLAFQMFNNDQPFRFDKFDSMKNEILDFIINPGLSTLSETIGHYENIKEELLTELSSEERKKKKLKLATKITDLSSKIDLVRTLTVKSRITSVSELVKKINYLSSNSNGPLLSTVHKAKGMEADEVYILDEKLFKTSEDQERNLLYVAITRALKNLYFISK